MPSDERAGWTSWPGRGDNRAHLGPSKEQQGLGVSRPGNSTVLENLWRCYLEGSVVSPERSTGQVGHSASSVKSPETPSPETASAPRRRRIYFHGSRSLSICSLAASRCPITLRILSPAGGGSSTYAARSARLRQE